MMLEQTNGWRKKTTRAIRVPWRVGSSSSSTTARIRFSPSTHRILALDRDVQRFWVGTTQISGSRYLLVVKYVWLGLKSVSVVTTLLLIRSRTVSAGKVVPHSANQPT